MQAWLQLFSDAESRYDTELTLKVDLQSPLMTWGTNPGQAIALGEALPPLAVSATDSDRDTHAKACAYMGLTPGQNIEGLPVDRVFIGSCTNGRLSDLIAAAQVVKGRRVAPSVRAMVVPGSMKVRREAEAMGLDKIFTTAGFEWRNAGCSMCVGMNADQVVSGERCIATSNRNFEGRQGPGARTHLASPASAAAAAIEGRIVDFRTLER